MKIFSALNKAYVRSTNTRNDLLKSEPSNLPECCELAKSAVQFSQWKDKQSTQLWALIINTCKNKSISFASVVEAKFNQQSSIIEAVIESRDWDSCHLIAAALRPGLYSDGSVEKTSHALILSKNGKKDQLGLWDSMGGCYFAGDLRDGKRNGKGLTKLLDDDVFECDYDDNQKHGWGVHRSKKDGSVIDEGLYINNVFIGNPKSPLPRQNGYFSSLVRK